MVAVLKWWYDNIQQAREVIMKGLEGPRKPKNKTLIKERREEELVHPIRSFEIH